MATSNIILRTAMVSISGPMVPAMRAHGSIANLLVLVFTSGLMAACLQVSGSTVRQGALACTIGQMVDDTRAFSPEISAKAMARL